MCLIKILILGTVCIKFQIKVYFIILIECEQIAAYTQIA